MMWRIAKRPLFCKATLGPRIGLDDYFMIINLLIGNSVVITCQA